MQKRKALDVKSDEPTPRMIEKNKEITERRKMTLESSRKYYRRIRDVQ